MDYIKDAFLKVKEDMDILRNQLLFLAEELTKIKEEILKINNESQKTQIFTSSTNNPLISTNPTYNPTDNLTFKPFKQQNLLISTGNKGVPTDKQTNRQTDKQIENSLRNNENSIENAFEILNSLDNIKREIRLKFKRLTEQEILVFSTIYQIEEEDGQADYRSVSKKLNLSESSIRDYVGRLVKKGIPVEKKKINNKTILLSISENLRKIVSLSTILQLRDL